MKIYPADVDAVVERFERASDVCTFALDDEIYGQAIGIAVVLSNKDDATIRALYSWMKVHLAEHKMPVRWWVVEEIPRTSRGKINRDAVKAACANFAAIDLNRILAGEKH
jgi:acyl-CoA synthetase (AMP-forming)/AMP-acid ligase II